MSSPYNKENLAEIPSFYQKVHHLKTIHVWNDFFSPSNYQLCGEEGLIFTFLKIPFSCPMMLEEVTYICF
jgi:hypothetical protein